MSALSKAELEAENFNLKFAVGAEVAVWAGLREGDGEIGKTTSEAHVYGTGRSAYAVVYVRRIGKAQSFFALSHVRGDL